MKLRSWIAPLLWAAIGAAIVGGVGSGGERSVTPEPIQTPVRDAATFHIGPATATSVR